jgi:hypothetical protein
MTNKKNFKNLVYMVFALSCATTMFISNSCTKPDKIVGSFKIKGYLYDSCGGAVVKGIPLRASYRTHFSAFSGTQAISDDSLGWGITDDKGYFEMMCKKYRASDGELTLFRVDKSNVSLYFINRLPSQNEIDLGKGYLNGVGLKGRIEVKLSGTFSTSDTLFVGNPSGAYEVFTNIYDGKKIYQDIKFKENYAFLDYNRPKYLLFNTYYGFGRANFKNTNTISYIATTCDMPDTTTSTTITK